MNHNYDVGKIIVPIMTSLNGRIIKKRVITAILLMYGSLTFYMTTFL